MEARTSHPECKMSLFSDVQMREIRDFIVNSERSVLITFRQKHGPTRLKKLWLNVLKEFVSDEECISWWSSAGQMGLLECETQAGTTIYGQWLLGDSNELIGMFEIDDEEALDIRDGFESANVASSAMRAYRIGESGGEKE